IAVTLATLTAALAVVGATVRTNAPLGGTNVVPTCARTVVASHHGQIGRNRLLSVTSVSAGQAWAVGWSPGSGVAHTLIERWNGTSWVVVPSPNASTSSNILTGVASASASDAWAVGYSFGANGWQTLAEH